MRTLGQSFREALMRRFGSSVRAWCVIDHERKGALTKSEFSKSVMATGYAGSPSLLWNELAGEESLITLQELDPPLFKHIVVFRNRVVRSKGSLKSAFKEVKGGPPTLRMTFEAFARLCEKVVVPKPWERLFEQLDAKSNGCLVYEDIKFIDDFWSWEEDVPSPIRNEAGNRTSQALDRKVDGHILAGLRPRQVTIQKSSSSPSLLPTIRNSWNNRHHVPTTLANSEMNLAHQLAHVETEAQERLQIRCLQKIKELPTTEWYQQLMGSTTKANFHARNYDDY